MAYAKFFSADSILPEMEAGDLGDTLEQLLEVLLASKQLGPAAGKDVKALLGEKVEQGATGAIGHGVAVPHVKTAKVKTTVAALGRIPGGVDFRAGDGVPVSLCFFVVGPEDAPTEHLDFLRWIAGLARDQDFPRFALQCSTREQLLDLIKEVGGG